MGKQHGAHLLILAVELVFHVPFTTSIVTAWNFTGTLALAFPVKKARPYYHLSSLARREKIMELEEPHNNSHKTLAGRKEVNQEG